MSSNYVVPASPTSVVRRWHRKVRRAEQVARLELIIVHVEPYDTITFAAVPQHDFGDPRYYDWSGTTENGGYGRDGRARPFDLVVGPPRPPHRSGAVDNVVVDGGIDEVLELLADARALRARRPHDVQTITLYHPILVVDSPLVLLHDDGRTEEIAWVRHERNSIVACDRTWVDVIAAEHFEKVVKKIQRVYAELYGRLRCVSGLGPAKSGLRPAKGRRR